MSEIKWEEPPAANSKGYETRYTRIANELRSSPGRWALIATGKTPSSATYAKRALGVGFEVVSRTNAGKTQDVYARFVGEATR